MNKATILVVEDDASLRQALKKVLERQDCSVSEAATLANAFRVLRSRVFDLILLDLKLPDGNGMRLLERQANAYPDRIIVITGTGSVVDAVAAMKRGAFDFIVKPFDRDLLLATLHKALQIKRKLEQLESLTDGLGSGISFSAIIHRSQAMAAVIERAKKLAIGDRTVLITGETGTGKELLAHAIHNFSPRRGHPFIAINCASIPETLAESELFGFKRGAFTGAHEAYPGKFVLAERGTIFLDEIGELPLPLQVKLLRVLESGEVVPLKSRAAQKVDVRVIAATNCDLEKKVRLNQFRKDLFYRIEQGRIAIPPLQERRADIEPLVEHFLHMTGLTQRKRIARIVPRALELLQAYSWPGNVRELKNAILETAAIIPGTEIRAEHLPLKIVNQGQTYPERGPTPDLAHMEKQHILQTLERAGHNRLRAANLLGISRASLYRKLKKFSSD